MDCVLVQLEDPDSIDEDLRLGGLCTEKMTMD